ncbi:MAG: yfiH [Marmoricola sp.]|nr:yfiH [Marmoricola sp.]
MYSHRSTHGPVDLAFTDRYGGVSGVPFDSLNLALEGDDDADRCAENLRIVIDDFAPGAMPVNLHQVHGSRVVLVEDWRSSSPPSADGLVARDQPDIVLVVRAADCVPVLFADPGARVIGVAHSGRPGLAAGIVPATVERMRAVGASEITAWIGPHVCGACYEVPEKMQAEVGAIEPAAVATTSWGTPSLDIGAGVRAQLERDGVRVVDVSRCTRESADLYSYRRDGRSSGRLAGLIRLNT